MQKCECSEFTINEHIGTLKQFTRWTVITNRLPTDPFAATKKSDPKLEKKRPRRALSAEEIGRLLSATLDRPLHELRTVRFGEHAGKQVAKVRPTVAAKVVALGQDRMLAYLLALWTGLRRSELRALQWDDVRLDTIPAKIALRAKTTKAKRANSIALHPQIATALRKAKPKSLKTGDRVLRTVPGMKVLRADLKYAGVALKTDLGRIDLHGMRMSLGTFLAANGIPQRVAQAHLRHTDPRLTATTYTDEALLPTAAAIAELPSLPTEPPKRLRATRTCDIAPTAHNATSGRSAPDPRAAPAQRAAHTLGRFGAPGCNEGSNGRDLASQT